MKVVFMGILFSKYVISLLLTYPSKTIDNHTKNSIISDSIPQINKKIIAFVKDHINTTVGRGECWDLAAQPLNELGAKWDKEYRYGREVNYKRDSIYPGDIIQFEGVEVQRVLGNMTIKSNLDHHTAIIYEVHGQGQYTLAHQNTSDFGRKVGLSEIDISNILRGNFTIYRPYK